MSQVSHMNSVVNSEELRAAYNACLLKQYDSATEMGQNEKLYQAYRAVAGHDPSGQQQRSLTMPRSFLARRPTDASEPAS